MNKILFFLACLWLIPSLAIPPVSILGLSGAYFGICALAQREMLNRVDPLSPIDKASVNIKLQNLYDRGLLRCKPDSISLSYGPNFAATGSINSCLFLKKGKVLDEFTALHEVGHINGMHTLSRLLILPAAACTAFRKGWSSSYVHNASRVAGSKLIADSVGFFQGKYCEWAADNHAAENCSDTVAFKDAINEVNDNEFMARRFFESKYKVSNVVALRTLHYLDDPHALLMQSRSERLQRIYDRRVSEGSLVE